MAIGTSTGVSVPMNYPLLFVDTGGTSNGVGIGTTTVTGTMLTVGTTTPVLVVANNGNVGIGTASPGNYKLKVNGDISGNSITISELYANQIYSGDGLTNITLTGGYVGIGNTFPTSKLTVMGSGAFSATGVATTTISSGVSTFAGGIISQASSTFAGNVSLGTSSSPTMFVDSGNGYVGIGTTTPQYTFDVVSNLASGDIATFRQRNTSNVARIVIDSPTDSNNRPAYLNLTRANALKWSAGLGYSDSNNSFILSTSDLGAGITGAKFLVTSAGNVGIATTTPRYKLDVWGDMAIGTSTGTNVPALYVDSGNGGYIGIGTASPGSTLTLSSTSDLAIGDFSSQIIDTLEDEVEYWTSSDTTNVATTTTTTAPYVRFGDRSLEIVASGASEDDTVRKSYDSAQNWSAYERIGFWIYANRIATSTATTTQLISFQVYDANNPSMITQNINIKKENQWQYQEVALNTTSTTAYDGVTYIQFRIDVGSLGVIEFFVDQIRLYDDDERTGDMFVDKNGSLVITGRKSVEIYAPQTGSGVAPGVKVDAAVVELGQPLAVNTGGDVGMDYDLQFLSTGLSQITSEGPLRIVGGDPNHAENLTLTTGGTGDVIVELSASSSSFMVTHAWAASTTVPFIINSESNSTTTAEMDRLGILFQIVSDYSTDENTVFSIDASGNYYYDRGAYTPAADVAENYRVEDESIGGGDVVCLNGTPLTIEKCSGAYQSNLIGVVSTRPALVMAADLEKSRSVALAGRVPVKISSENGSIEIGDPLTSASSTLGAAMKAIGAGKILGYALEAFNASSTTSTNTILAFINLQERNAGDLTVYENNDGNLEVKTLTQNGLTTLFSLDEEGAMVVNKLKTQELCVGSVCVTENEFMQVFGAGVASAILGSSTSTVPTSTDQACVNGTNQACSSEIGACQIGVQICEGGVWGECIGAVLPTEEICDEVDNDCDGLIDEEGACSAPAPESEPEPEPEPEPLATSTEPIIEPIATSTEPIATSTSSGQATSTTP
ncbi:MAG: hypothetical protein PHO90_00310 [Candidatus Pacebacteria bacterium]|nr:hypothetical protein [Candidatus Paceibacterota bacterium]